MSRIQTKARTQENVLKYLLNAINRDPADFNPLYCTTTIISKKLDLDSEAVREALTELADGNSPSAQKLSANFEFWLPFGERADKVKLHLATHYVATDATWWLTGLLVSGSYFVCKWMIGNEIINAQGAAPFFTGAVFFLVSASLARVIVNRNYILLESVPHYRRYVGVIVVLTAIAIGLFYYGKRDSIAYYLSIGANAATIAALCYQILSGYRAQS